MLFDGVASVVVATTKVPHVYQNRFVDDCTSADG
jgi:hypothetical protein